MPLSFKEKEKSKSDSTLTNDDADDTTIVHGIAARTLMFLLNQQPIYLQYIHYALQPKAANQQRSLADSVGTDRLLQCIRLLRCLECFYQDYDILRLANSICWIASPGVTGDTSKKGTWLRSTRLGVVSGLLKATSAGHHSDQSRSAADAPGRGWTIHVFGKFTSWDRDALSAIGSAA